VEPPLDAGDPGSDQRVGRGGDDVEGGIEALGQTVRFLRTDVGDLKSKRVTPRGPFLLARVGPRLADPPVFCHHFDASTVNAIVATYVDGVLIAISAILAIIAPTTR
jgi:hypothetical protein